MAQQRKASPDQSEARRGPESSTGATLLPHSIEAEESILGAMLLSRDAVVTGSELCTSADFYRPAHGHIFDAIVSLYAKGEPADPITVAQALRDAQLLDMVGGSGALVGLQAGTPGTVNAEHYARIVEQHATLRRLIEAASEINDIGYSHPTDVDEALNMAQQKLYDVSQRRRAETPMRIGDSVLEWIDDMEARSEKPELRGIKSGLHVIDQRIGGGFKPGKLYVIAARPGGGKSVFTAQLAGVAAHREKVVHIANVEMSRHEHLERWVAQQGVPALSVTSPSRTGTDWHRVGQYAAVARAWPIRVVDAGQQTVQRVIADAMKTRREEGGRLDLLIVDYLQQLHIPLARMQTRDQAIGEVMYRLKAVARDMNIPVVVCVQLSRLSEKENRRPRKSDLRESGSIEQAADVIIALHDVGLLKGRRPIPFREVLFLKNRQGPEGVITRIGWVPSRVMFVNAARPSEMPEPRHDPTQQPALGDF